MFPNYSFWSCFKDKRYFWMAAVTTLVMWLVFSYEMNIVSIEERQVYLVTKLTVIISLSFVSIMIALNPFEILWQNLYTILAYAYMIQGDYFRPNYFIAFLQFISVQALAFRQSRLTFTVLHVIGVCLLSVSINMNISKNITRLSNSHSAKDYIMMLVTGLLVSLIVFFQINKVREEKDKNQSRFLLLGKQASNIIHDLKALSSTPQVYLDMLFDQKKDIDPQTIKVLIHLQNDLSIMVKRTKDLYHMIQVQDINENKDVISNHVDKVLEFLSTRMHSVQIIRSGDSKWVLPQGPFELIILNLCYNSLEAWNKNRISNPTLQVQYKDEKVILIDNAGGIPEDFLEEFRSDRFNKNKGLGLFLIKDSAQLLNLNMKIENITSLEYGKGLKVEISKV